MPFTLAHPGFILILYKKWAKHFNLIGLFVGSIVPDFDILFRITHSRFHIFTYGKTDIFLFILPISIAITLYFDLFFKSIKKQQIQLDLSAIIKIIYSCLLAIIVHLFLDNYVHFNAAQIIRNFDHKTNFSYTFYNRLYYFIIYGPSIISSLIGFLLINYTINFNTLCKPFLLITRRNRNSMLLISSIAFSLFLTWKMYVTGLENGFYFDGIVTVITASLIFTILIVPINYYILLKLTKHKLL